MDVRRPFYDGLTRDAQRGTVLAGYLVCLSGSASYLAYVVVSYVQTDMCIRLIYRLLAVLQERLSVLPTTESWTDFGDHSRAAWVSQIVPQCGYIGKYPFANIPTLQRPRK